MSTKSLCGRPFCKCDPCTCSSCKCEPPRLGELERRVMEVIWDRVGVELTARNIAELFDEYAYTTLATVLDRLVQKGLLHRRMEGRTARFVAIESDSTHAAMVMLDVLALSRNRDAALLDFVDMTSRSDAQTLRKGLRDRRAEAGESTTDQLKVTNRGHTTS